MPLPFDRLIGVLDHAIDRRWGERIEIVPWAASSYSRGAADATRPVTATVGEVFFGAAIETPAPGAAQMIEADATASVPKAAAAAAGAKAGDRIRLLDRSGTDAVMEIGRAIPDATSRVVLHLVRLAE